MVINFPQIYLLIEFCLKLQIWYLVYNSFHFKIILCDPF